MNLKNYIGKSQASCLKIGLNGTEKKAFYEILSNLYSTIESMPKTYETDGQGEKAIAYLHYFNAGSDWYITEKDQEEIQLQAFGYAILNGDMENSELGYINIQELIDNNVELDLYWNNKTLKEILNEKEE